MGGSALLQREGRRTALQSQELRLGVPKEPMGDLGPDRPRRGREAIRERESREQKQEPHSRAGKAGQSCTPEVWKGVSWCWALLESHVHAAEMDRAWPGSWETGACRGEAGRALGWGVGALAGAGQRNGSSQMGRADKDTLIPLTLHPQHICAPTACWLCSGAGRGKGPFPSLPPLALPLSLLRNPGSLACWALPVTPHPCLSCSLACPPSSWVSA